MANYFSISLKMKGGYVYAAQSESFSENCSSFSLDLDICNRMYNSNLHAQPYSGKACLGSDQCGCCR